MKTIEDRLLGLIDETREVLREEDTANITDLVRHREWGVALEVLCTQIDEFDLTISRSAYEEIRSLADQMNMDASIWKDINCK